ncbi:MAG TPA: hypothetical protein VM389_02935, partial [Phycisphaerae bacterium]|nr:hypothetical protein [Phycisphaerae bacterium]
MHWNRPVTPALLAALVCTFLSSCAFVDGPVGDSIGPADRAATQAIAPSAAGGSKEGNPPAVPGAGGLRPATASAATLPASGPLKLTVTDTIISALAHNAALRVERINPVISRTFEQQERAVFDPVLSAGLQRQRTRFDTLAAGRASASTSPASARRG